MHGATGLGKTHLSLAIANVVAEKGTDAEVLWVKENTYERIR